MLSRLRDALSFHRTGLRVLWLLHGLDRALLPALVIDSVVRVAATYGSLALTALLVNGLMALEWRACAAAAAGIVALNAFAGVVGRVCGYHRQDGAWVSWLAFQLLTRKKALALDYETAASPAFQSRIATLDQTVRIRAGSR